jgi:hypothetical protein
VFVALLMAYSSSPTLFDRFAEARYCAVAMHRTRRRPGRSYRGFAKALATRGSALLASIAEHLRRTLERDAKATGQWTTCGFVVFGVDSSKFDCTMTRANEEAIGVAGRRKSWPQLVLTCLFHVGTNVPWAFKRGDAKASERKHLLELLSTLPARAPNAKASNAKASNAKVLILADAGFVGYEFFTQILASERQFLVRIGANVKLLRGLYADAGLHAEARGESLVYLWPDKAQKKNKPPLTLRLVTVVDGRNRRMHLLTAVMDEKALSESSLSDAQVAGLYAMRWSVELKFRALKQTMDRRKLLSDAPESARAECDWSAMGHWMLEMMSWRESRSRNRSVASALRAVRRAMSRHNAMSGNNTLTASPAASVGDCYRRTSIKKSRHWPHKKRDKPPGQPLARTATKNQITHAARLTHRSLAA